VSEEDVRTNRPRTHSPPRIPAAAKGKGKLITSDNEQDEIVAQSDNSEDSLTQCGREAGQRKSKKGRIDHDGKEAIKRLGDVIEGLVDDLAKRLGRSTVDILLRMGFGLRARRKNNTWNKFRMWYCLKHPKPEGGLSAIVYFHSMLTESPAFLKDDIITWTNTVRNEYDAFKRRANWADPDARAQAMKPIMAYLDDVDANNPGLHLPASTRMKTAINQFSSLVSVPWLAVSIPLTPLQAQAFGRQRDIEVVGLCIYVGDESANDQFSSAFFGTERAKAVCDANNVAVKRVLSSASTALKLVFSLAIVIP
jgi:hypothetical protein